MNYPKQIKRKEIAKRIIISWVVVGVIWFLIGFLVCWLILHIPVEQSVEQSVDETTEQKEFTVYGAYDDRCFTSEISLDWCPDEEFEALDCDLDKETQEFVYYLCKGYDIDFTLVMAIMQAESSFRPELVSETGDYGLMQINKANHTWITKTIGVMNYLDPKENVRAGCFVIRKLFEKYQKSEMVLMAYHFGEHGAKTLWNEGVYESKYSQSVLKYQKQFSEQMEGD